MQKRKKFSFLTLTLSPPTLAICLSMLLFTSAKQLQAQSPPPQPNVILVITDDEAWNYVKYMPYLSSRPGGHWVKFTNAYPNLSLCCPSRSSILTGQYAHYTGVMSNDGAPFNDASTLATWLQGAGYTTAFFGKYLNGYPFPDQPSNYIPPGWSQWYALTRGHDFYFNSVINENGTLVSYGSTAADYSTDVLAGKATKFIASAPEPFFVDFAPFAPHQPHTPAPRHLGKYNDRVIDHPPNFNEADVSDKPARVRKLALLTADQIKAMDTRQRRAAESLLAVDEALKAMMDKLAARGIVDHTVIIFISDNGYSWGSHRWEYKAWEYEESMRVPLLIRYPWADPRSESRLVQNVDLAPTIAELAGVTIPLPLNGRNSIDGRSLLPLLTNTVTSWRSSILIEGESKGWWGVVRADGTGLSKEWKYVELKSGEKELYDLVHDPYELQNVAGQPAYSAIQASLASELQQLKSQ